MRKLHPGLALLSALLIVSVPATGDSLSYDIDPSAELRKVAFYQRNVRSASSEQLVVFEVTLKNVDTTPRLYSVTVHIPGAGASEDFAPAKGDDAVAPGEEATASVAILAGELPSTGFSIMVRPVSER